MKLAVLRSLQGFKEHGLGTFALGYPSLLPNMKRGLEDCVVLM